MKKLVVNGTPELAAVENLAAFVHEKGLQADALVIEHNGIVVVADQWENARLQDGDRLELLSFVGGG